MTDLKKTKKEMAREIFLEHFNRTGQCLSGYSLHKQIEADVRTLCRYAAEFKIEVGVGPQTPGHREEGLKAGENDDACIDSCFERHRLVKEMGELTKEIKRLSKEDLTTQQVKQYIFNMADVDIAAKTPKWVLDIDSEHSLEVPCLLMSDVHYSEVVNPLQVFGVNEYNREISTQRIKNLAENLIDLLINHINHGEYPGIVLLLAGDFLSGNIHDELVATNDMPIMPSFIELLGIMSWFIRTLADALGNVMVFGTAGGNHTRMTKRVPAKDKAYTNFDWLLYRMLEREFKEDKNINFFISDGDDVQFKILNHRYRMTHGDQFRGGTGFIGPFAPITRNETKKRSAAQSYGQNYDTLVIGHFHQRMMMGKVNVNGSVVGYNEFAINCNFSYEPPQQSLWLTHAKKGITGSWPVFCEKTTESMQDPADWVSWNTMDQGSFNEITPDKAYG